MYNSLTIPAGKELRPYQVNGVEFMLARERMILGDDPGVGKTPQAVVVLATLGVPDTLIVCPKNAIGVWEFHLEDWLGIKAKSYQAGKGKVADIKSHGVLITNYEQLAAIRKHREHWPVIIFDESHRLRNRKTLAYKRASGLTASYLYFLTGTPVFKGAHDLWTTLHMVAPSAFGSYWSFVDKYCFKDNNGFGWQIHGIKDPLRLAQDLAPYFLRRRKAEVLSELPQKIRGKIPLHMTPVQRKHYIELAASMMTETDEGYVISPSVAVTLVRLRELLVSPRLLGIDDDGAAIPALIETMEERRTPTLVFTPFREGVAQIARAARAEGWQATELTGGLTSLRTSQRVREFQEGTNPRRVLVCTVQMGTAWTATAAQQTFFVGYDWAPQIDVQAEDRMHRYGGTGYECYYFVHTGTVDEHVMEVLSGKVTIENLIINHRLILDRGRL